MEISTKRGRKAFKPTKAQRDRVTLLFASGMSEQSISAVINVSHATLRKHFIEELTFGHSRKIAENLGRLDRAAKSGNVAAMKYLQLRLEALPRQDKPKPEPLGKKEQAKIEAETAHEKSGWGKLLN